MGTPHRHLTWPVRAGASTEAPAAARDVTWVIHSSRLPPLLQPKEPCTRTVQHTTHEGWMRHEDLMATHLACACECIGQSAWAAGGVACGTQAAALRG